MTKTLKERITELEKRMDDFNVRNEKLYAQMKDYLILLEKNMRTLENELRSVRAIAHKHFWMGD